MSEPGDDPAGGLFRRGWTVLLVAATVLVLGVVVIGFLLNRGDPTVALADRLEPPSGAVPTAPTLRAGEVLTRLPAGSAVLSTVSVQPHGYAVEARRLSDGSLWWSYRRPSSMILRVVRTGPTSAAALWSDGRLQVLDSLTGRSLWQRTVVPDRTLGESDSAELQVTTPARDDDLPRVLVLTVAGSTQAYDATNGAPLWQRPGTVVSASSTVVVLRGAPASTGPPSPSASASVAPEASPSESPSAPERALRSASPAAGGVAVSGAQPASVFSAYAAQTGAPLGVLHETLPGPLSASANIWIVATDAVTLTLTGSGEGTGLSAFPPLTATAPPGTPSPSESGSGTPGATTDGTAGGPVSGGADSGGAAASGPATSPGSTSVATPTSTESGTAGGDTSSGGTDALSPDDLELSQPWWERSFPSSASASPSSAPTPVAPSASVGVPQGPAASVDRLGVAVATPLSDLVTDIAPVVVVVERGAVSAFTVRTGAPVEVMPRRVPVSGVLEAVSIFRDRLVISTTGEVVVVGLELQPPV